MKRSFFQLAALAVLSTSLMTTSVLANCVSGPLCSPATIPTVNPILQGITLHSGGIVNFQSGGQVVAGVGEAWSGGQGGVDQNLGLVFTGAGLCPDDPNCTDVGVTGSLTAFGGSTAGAFATDSVLAQTAGMAQSNSILQVQVILGDLFPAAPATAP